MNYTFTDTVAQTPDYWESSPSRGCVIPQSFIDGLSDFNNGRVTDDDEDYFCRP